nr:membrane protein m162 [Mastomys natalensis cytomegalovirus 3]WEG69985.1 membrane protein m162 [Mastomys natalensis cytomegalovirus 3]WEG70125.1 membrane protein m162 [Mastomys natalensis cytomegalovirus 3]WEG70265.1 membrane protein m162 [Mastomys natalensis cytomegalovirus 3]WEG70405.1 membrane protein m162 [Mastomys natalensis cytomegalovirus 3]
MVSIGTTDVFTSSFTYTTTDDTLPVSNVTQVFRIADDSGRNEALPLDKNSYTTLVVGLSLVIFCLTTSLLIAILYAHGAFGILRITRPATTDTETEPDNLTTPFKNPHFTERVHTESS